MTAWPGRPVGCSSLPCAAGLIEFCSQTIGKPSSSCSRGQQDLFVDAPATATLGHDDLHHGNVLFARRGIGWRLAGVIDWDKAWAEPAESDVARMAFWDDMTGPGFWQVYEEAVTVMAGGSSGS